MIRLVELSPAAGDELVYLLGLDDIGYKRVGTRFTFPEGDMPHKMMRLSRLVGFTTAKFGNLHLIEDKYV